MVRLVRLVRLLAETQVDRDVAPAHLPFPHLVMEQSAPTGASQTPRLAINQLTTASGFSFPPLYSFPPFFTSVLDAKTATETVQLTQDGDLQEAAK